MRVSLWMVGRAGLEPATSASFSQLSFRSFFASSEKSKAEELFKGLVSPKTGFYTQKKAKLSSKNQRLITQMLGCMLGCERQ